MTNRNLLSKKIILGLATATLCYGPFGVGYAEDAPQQPTVDISKILPTGATGSDIDQGNVKIYTSDTAPTMNMNVFQTTDRAVINWNTFNVGKGSTVNFIQTKDGKPNVSAMTLNRVADSGGMSEIAGHINSIGSFILVNPNGTMFYDGSEVNAAGVIVSTAEIDEDKFKNGQLYFKQNSTTNANITVNGTINASTNGSYMTGEDGLLARVKADLKDSPLNLDGIELATGFSFANNTIKLVADGDITVGEKGSLQAVTSTTISGDKTVGTEEFSVEGDSSTRLGSITLRADQNADDVNKDGKAAKVYLNYDYNKDAPQIASHSVGIYYNPDIVSKEATVESLGITGANATNYTQKDYTNYSKEAEAYKGKVAQTFNQFSRDKNKNAVETSRNIVSQSYNMLVNNLYQLEAIQYSDKANMGGSYAQGTSFQAENTKYWNDGKGFKSIGSTDNVFHGGFTGHGGSNTYSITDLTINRPDEDNVGLFGVAEKASFWSVNLVDANIKGHDNVGGIVGQATDHSKISSISVRKSIPANNVISETNNITGNDNVGGIVGEISNGGTIRFSSNNAQIGGNNKVGGLVGSLSGGAAGGSDEGSSNNIYKSSNSGVIQSSGTSAGGLAGYINSTLNTKDNKFATGDNITTDPTDNLTAVAITDSYSNGKVSGTTDVGGIVGTLENGTIQYTYNTNENAALSSNSVIGKASVGAGTSVYGKVTGTTNVGGIVGNISGGAIDQSYNAGNIEGTKNVGGVVGSMSGGSINKAYNADNNTVLKTSTNDAEYYGFTVKNESNTIDSYTYDNNKQTWLKNGTEQITADQLKAVPENTRMYYNRLAYRDATVTGTNNVGGVVGSMSDGTMEQVYNAGQVKAVKSGDNEASNVGAFIGNYSGGTVKNSFYVTTENDGVTNITNQDKAAGNVVDSADASNISSITSKTLYQAQNTTDTNWTDGKNTANGWTIYNNSSTPLLNHFMKWININRQYEYDGTVHNLMTTDVTNYYGGAFFDNGDGKDVYSTTGKYGTLKSVMGGYKASDWVIKSGQVTGNDDQDHISVYTYDNSTMWSPQHGYYTSDDARMIITPKTVTATIVGEKTYGEDAVVGVKAADGTATYLSNPHSSNYSMDVTGFIGDDTADSVFKVDRSVAKYKDDNNQLGAGTYDKVEEFINPTFDYKDNNYNYKVEFKDTLKVNKADLYVDIVGTKVYGNDVSTGSYKYYAHEKNTKDEGSEISVNDVNNDGKLKSWETALATKEQAHVLMNDKVTALEADDKVTHNSITTDSKVINEFTDVIGKDKDGKFVPQAYKLSKVDIEGINDTNKQLKTLEQNYNLIFDMAKGSEGEVTVTPREIKMEVVGEKVYGQDALKGSVTITGTVTSEALANASKDGHYVVKIDGYKEGDNPALEADFKDITYSQDSNKLDVGTYTNSSAFNNPTIKNNNFDGTTAVNHNYTGKVTNKLTVKKADLYINVDGSKQYGDGINGDTASYTYSVASKNEANANHTATEKDKKNDGSLKSWDTISSSNIDKSKVTSVTANAAVYHNDVQQSTRDIGDGSNVITDSTGKIISYGVEKMSFATGAFDNLKNYNVIFKSGTMKITPAKLTVKSFGTKNYGEAPLLGGVLGTTPVAGKYNITASGFVAGDTMESAFTYNFDKVSNDADTKQLGDGIYKNSANFTNPEFMAKQDNTHNYNITYENELTVTKVASAPPITSLPSRGTFPAPTTGPSELPASDPIVVPVTEPTTTPASEPTTIPTNEPATTPAIEPTTVPANEPTTAPASKPTDNSNTETLKIPNDVIIEINKATEDINTESKKVDEERKKIRYDGYNPKEARDGIRFITVEDTGINVEDAKVEHTTITIEPDSLVDENSEIIINGSNEAAE